MKRYVTIAICTLMLSGCTTLTVIEDPSKDSLTVTAKGWDAAKSPGGSRGKLQSKVDKEVKRIKDARKLQCSDYSESKEESSEKITLSDVSTVVGIIRSLVGIIGSMPKDSYTWIGTCIKMPQESSQSS